MHGLGGFMHHSSISRVSAHHGVPMREQGSLSSKAMDHPIQLLFLSQGVNDGRGLVVLEARSSEAAFSSDIGDRKSVV